MEERERGYKQTRPFYERMTSGLNGSDDLYLPDAHTVKYSGIEDIASFNNAIPAAAPPQRGSLIRPHFDNEQVGSDDVERFSSHRHAQSILLPTLIICVPITLLAATLLALVLIFRVVPNPSLFGSSPPASVAYILVDFSSTRLVFVASFLSTVAPLLGSYIMSLTALPVSRALRDASRDSAYLKLPTPFQMSLLIGILVAAIEQLRSYFGYLLSQKHRPEMPPVLHRSAMIMTLSIVMAGGVFLSDTILHYTTSTIEFDQISVSAHPDQNLGRGLSEFCLTFNRTVVGLPCSVEYDFVDPNKNFQETEVSRLLHNTSQQSTIQFTDIEDPSRTDIAYLAASEQAIAVGTDFQASTIGISTQCELVSPSSCQMTSWGDNQVYTNFSCSDMFHGTIGKPPNVSDVSSVRVPDAYRSFLMYKPAQNLMYSFFSNKSMETVYNSVGWNDSGLFDLSIYPLEDSQLLNPFYLGLAARVAYVSFDSDSEMLTTNDTKRDDHNSIVDFVINCAVTSYDVTYTWVNQSLHNISTTPTANGSVLEIFHGSQLYSTVSGGSFDLQDFLTQAAMGGTTRASFLRQFGALYSSKVLAKIGGYMTNRVANQQQQRQHMLLSKVPIAPLAMLIAWSLGYTVMGLVLSWRAYRATQDNVQDIAAKLSLLGLSQAAFEDPHTARAGSTGTSKEDLAQKSRHETRRVIVDGSAKQGFEFRVVV